jgi:iron complex transport system ATP-binding protein
MIIRCDNVSRKIAGHCIFADFSMEFQPGTLYAVLGRNGAGKTSLLRCLSGMDAPSSGKIEFSDVKNQSLAQTIYQKLAWVPASSERTFDFTLSEMVLMGRYPYHLGFPTDHDLEQCHSAIAAMRISHLSNRSIRSLSTGEFQKAMICRALALNPEAIVMDEPAAHLDWPSTHEFFNMMRMWAEQGKTVIASLHDPFLAQKYAHQALGIKDSRVLPGNFSTKSIGTEFFKDVFDWLPDTDPNH